MHPATESEKVSAFHGMKLQDSIPILKKLSQLEQQSTGQGHLNDRNWILKSCSRALYCFWQWKMVAESSQTLLKLLSNDQEKELHCPTNAM